MKAVCKNASNKVVCPPSNGEVEFKTNPVPCTKHKHKWNTWIKRGLAIFMMLHPQMFKGNAEDASIAIGVARSTLLGCVSMNPKTILVPKWFDIVSRLS